MASNLHLLTAEPQGQGIVALLEQLLTEAKAGELSSIAIASVDREGVTLGRWSDAPSFGLLIGSIARLQHHIIEAGVLS